MAGILNLLFLILAFPDLYHVRYTPAAACRMFCNLTVRKVDYSGIKYITIMGGSYRGELRERDNRQLAVMALHSDEEIPNIDMRADSNDDHLIRDDEVLKSDIIRRQQA